MTRQADEARRELLEAARRCREKPRARSGASVDGDGCLHTIQLATEN